MWPDNNPTISNPGRAAKSPGQPQRFITLDDITVRLGDAWLLKGLSWQILRGQNWVVWGANGAGKTTLAKALLGEAAIVQGAVRRYDQNDPCGGERHDDIALVSSDQQITLHRREQILGHMRHFSGRVDETTYVADHLDLSPSSPVDYADMLGLATLLDKPVQALSAGEMRKLLIGRALSTEPQLLILDEPFNGLDADTRDNLLQILDAMALHHTQMVLITHRREDIAKAFTHLLHLDQGRVSWSGPVGRFFARMDRQAAPAKIKEPATTPPPRAYTPSKEAPDDGGPMIEMHGIHVAYGDTAVLKNIHWTVNRGENWALIGPNGAGKSTLLKLITGDNVQGYANDLKLFGRPKGSGESVWEIKQHIGYVADDLQLRYQKKMSGFDVVCSGFFDSVGLYRLCSSDQKTAARQWLARTRTEHLAERTFSKLSFGQQRMLLIVRAMVKTPHLLILDEPCNGLDAENRQLLLNMLDRIVDSGLTNLLYVSHRPDEMPLCITHRLLLSAGSLVETFKVRD